MTLHITRATRIITIRSAQLETQSLLSLHETDLLTIFWENIEKTRFRLGVQIWHSFAAITNGILSIYLHISRPLYALASFP